MRIIAYTYEAAMHCPKCTLRQFTIGRLALAHPCANDEHGVPYDLLDREGNEVRPVFITDEIEPYDACDDCGEAIE